MTAILGVLLFVLKCIGIILLGLLGLVLLVVLSALIVPVRYRGKLKKQEEPNEVFWADGLVSWLNPLVRVRIRYTEKKLSYAVRLFGICIMNSEKPDFGKKKETVELVQKEESFSEESTEESTEDSAENFSGDFSGDSPEDFSGDSPGEFSEETVPKESEKSSAEDKKKESLFVKIKNFFEKVKAFPGTLKEKVTRLVKTIKLLWHKKERVVVFLQGQFHKQALGTAWKTVKKAFRHILPGKVRGHLEFGTGDPESTGKALGILGILYAGYGKGITVVPDFYEKRVVADLTFKGRIRFGTLFVMLLSLIRDKQVKRFRKNWKKLLKVLKQKVE